MPQADEGPGVGFRIPGVYAALIPHRPSVKRPDPRLWLCDDAAELARLDALKAEAEAEEEIYRAEAIEVGEPFEVPRYRIGGNHFPLERGHPLRDRSVKKLRVHVDDMVQPIYHDD